MWSCQKCGGCCRNMPGKYLPSDFVDIYQELKKMVLKKTVEFDSWDHPEIFGADLKKIWFPRPAKKSNGSCVFLTKENLCGIYAERPSECRELKNCTNSNAHEFKKEVTITLNSLVKAIEVEHAHQLNFIFSWIKYQELIKQLRR